MKFTFADAIIAIGYASKIHGTDDAIRNTAKRLIKRVPGRHRRAIFDFINHSRPLLYTRYFFATMPDSIMTMELRKQ